MTAAIRFGLFLHYLLRRFAAHGCMQTAAALTFTTLLALVPALVLVLGILGTVPYFASYAQNFRAFAFANLVPEAAGRVTSVYMEQFVQHAGKLTLVGTVLLALSVLGLLLMLDRAFNGIWQVARPRPLWQRVLRSLAFVVVGPLLIGVSLSFGTRFVSLLFGKTYLPGGGEKALLHLIPVALNALVLALIYRVVPKVYVPWRHVLMTSVLVAMALDLMKLGFGWYVRYVVSYRLIYGTFAGLPIFLLWLYVCWIVVLFGAVMSATWSHRGRPVAAPLPTPWQRLVLARRVLHALHALPEEQDCPARRYITVNALQRTSGAGFDELAHVLDQLTTLGWVHVTRRGIVALDRALTPTDEALEQQFLGKDSKLE